MALTVTVDGNDLTDFLQDRSLSAKRNGVDFTLIDPSSVPAVNDTVALTDPTWSGAVNSVESAGYKGNVPFYRVRGVNTDVLVDGGAAPFNLSDAPNNSTTFGFKDLTVNRQLQGATVETRAKCIVFEPGLEAGMEIDITSVVEGFTGETFTIMDLTTEYPTEDGPTFALDLGLGGFATATTGADDGGPLDPIDLTSGIIDVVTDAGCCGDDDGGGSGGGGSSSDGITDDFNRTVASDPVTGWGTATCGLDWSLSSDDSTSYVDGNLGVMDLDIKIGDNGQAVATLEGGWHTIYDRPRTVEFRLDGLPAGSTFLDIGGKMCGIYWKAHIDVRAGMGSPFSTFGFPASTTTAIPTAFWVAGRTYTVTQVDDGTNVTNSITDGTTTYDVPKGAPVTYQSFNDIVISANGETTGTAQHRLVSWDNLDVPEVTRNSVQRLLGVRPIHIEYFTLPALGASPESQTADAYYDYAFNAATSDDLSAVGFATADDITFTATRAGMVSIAGYFEIDATPTGTDNIVIVCPGFGTLNHSYSLNTGGAVTIARNVYVSEGDFVRLDLYGTVADNPVTYAVLTLSRVGE